LTFLSTLVNISLDFCYTQELSMTDIPKLDETTFPAEVLHSSLPVLVDFTAVWCGPCKMLEPVITQLSQEWTGKVKFVKLDVDDNADLTIQYGVMGVPTLILFVNGQPVQRLSGYHPKDQIISKFSSFI
jgi:thioredoxin 1